MNRSVTNRDKRRTRGDESANKSANKYSSLKLVRKREVEWEMGNRRKGAYQMYLPCAYHNTCLKAQNTLGNVV